MIAEVQCIPSPAGTPQDAYQHVDAAIAAIADSGLPYEVGALGTTLEGAPDAVWDAIRAAHEASANGADGVVTVIKVFSAAGPEPSVDDLVSKHR